ncbi:hypothetical protein Q8A73_011831 [Channa argus]|nr:hypothetical protein Q8A73_011831 [Channa argus]
MWLIGLVTLLHCASAYDVDVKKLDGLAKARVEASFPEVYLILCSRQKVVLSTKDMWWMTAEQTQREVANFLKVLTVFLFVAILDHYISHNLVMKHIPGADPELVLLNHYYEELDRIALSDLTRSEINELLGTLGFYKKAQPEDEVPEEFRFSPAKDSPFKDESAGKSYTSSLATENSPGPNAEVEHTDL